MIGAGVGVTGLIDNCGWILITLVEIVNDVVHVDISIILEQLFHCFHTLSIF
jgi:hypothetical protein